MGSWLKTARRFIDTHAGELAQAAHLAVRQRLIFGDPPLADDPDALRADLAEKLV